MDYGRRGLLAHLPLLGAISAPAQPSRSLEARLLAELEAIETVNTHEHIIPESERVSQRIDFFTLAGHYAISDLMSAGLSAEALKVINDADAPAAIAGEPSSPTGSWRALPDMARPFGSPCATSTGSKRSRERASAPINDAIPARNKPGIYSTCSKSARGFDFQWWTTIGMRCRCGPDPDLFVLAHKFDRFVRPWDRRRRSAPRTVTGDIDRNPEGAQEALEKNFQQSLDAGMVTVKTTLAYDREIHFREVDEADASRDFDRMMGGREALPEGFRRHVNRPFRDLEDHMFHCVVQLADSRKVPVSDSHGPPRGKWELRCQLQPNPVE